MKVIIAGAGMAGLACATALRSTGQEVLLLDKGRGPGGRMASRRLETPLGEAVFDLGAPAFTARDPMFQEQVQQWAELGAVAPWAAAGHDAWVGVPAMNAPLKALARELDVHWGTRVSKLSSTPDGWTITTDGNAVFRADAVVVALPAEQTADLLASVAAGISETARCSPSTPCWTVMLAFHERLPFPEDYLVGSDDGPLGLAIRNRAKPGRSGPETWVVHAGSDWSARNLESSSGWIEETVFAALVDRLAVKVPVPIACAVHRWRYATPASAGVGAAWDPRTGLGICGDWVAGPGVQGAWRSGMELARLVAGTSGARVRPGLHSLYQVETGV
jgi:predicted NAD/FAD-dependent oxidoreductase